jgi:hypothetical protein
MPAEHIRGPAEWLRRLELELPEDEIVDGHNDYSSRWFSQRPDQAWPPDWWWKVVRLGQPHRGDAVVQPLSAADRTMLTLRPAREFWLSKAAT